MRLLKRFVRQEEGYTLVVIAALFTAFAVVVTAYLDRNTVTQQLDYYKDTRQQLSRLSDAIIQYAIFEGKYPCPANPQLFATDANFGAEVTPCNSGDQGGLDELPNSAGFVTRGMVPVRSLAAYGIDVSDAYDSYGGAIMYVVQRQRTVGSAAGVSGWPNLVQTPIGTSWNMNFILVSYGRDRMGAYLKNRNGAGTVDVGCGSGIRGENCNGDTSFRTGPPVTGAAVGIGTGWGDYFDDIVTGQPGQ